MSFKAVANPIANRITATNNATLHRAFTFLLISMLFMSTLMETIKTKYEIAIKNNNK